MIRQQRQDWKGRPLFYAALAAMLLPAAPAPLPAQDRPSASPARAAPSSTASRIDARTGHPARPAEVMRVQVRSELAIDRWLRPGEYAWNDDGVPPGKTVIVVNIRARVMSVYRGGIEIGRSSILYGADDKPTPTGTFPILEKKRDHVSNLYNAPMPHMLRLTWDGIAIHGSPEVADDAATRGCVGLPREFAALLFGVTKVGDEVVIWSGLPNA
ncbi:MAG: L,D-transpeptidase family protein [Allosphingosinicella sp.]|uniref:L,D-transpeptidase family protein n=1 Tax=Allosphingosinicella sp. TaxID=2823234 RepID=UPI003940E252